MRAAILSNDPSAAPVLVGDWPAPQPRPGWVVVRIVASALNQLDAMTVSERTDFPAPAVIGSDAAGVVDTAGPGVDGIVPGDQVIVLPSLWWGEDDAVQGSKMEILGYPTQGTHAELVTVPAENVFPKPARLSWHESAALPLAGVTAWRALVTRGQVKAGEVVIVTAASSGVGTFAIQLATALGARVVAITSSPERAAQARSLGATDALLRGEPGLAERLRAITGAGADLVIDPAGGSWGELLRALRPGGRLVSVGKKANDEAEVPLQALYWRQLSLLGSSMGSPRDFAALLAHLDRAHWRPVIDSAFPLAEIQAAYARLEAPERFGKVVLDMTPPHESA